MDWQQGASLAIVAVTAVLLLRSWLRGKRAQKPGCGGCDGCAAAEPGRRA